MSLLLVTKQSDYYSARAAEFARAHFPDVTVVTGKRSDPLPEAALSWRGDLLVSYLSPWIIPAELLARATSAAINFHPGPPAYPGIGCTNFALYDGAAEFGITCHHMAPKVDTGAIIAVKRFAVLPDDTVWNLTQRCYSHILTLYYEVLSLVAQGKPLPQSGETWQRAPYRRSELNALCKVTPDMSAEEIQRRVRAVSFPNMPGAYVELGGVRFAVPPPPIPTE